MAHLLHIVASPMGAESKSRQIGEAFVQEYQATHPNDTVDTWNLWEDGALPPFDLDAVNGRLAIFYGRTPEGKEATAWQAVLDTFARFAAAERLVVSIPMWNHSVPWRLKQFIDCVSQPGTVFFVDPENGYTHLLADKGKKAAVIYTSAVYAPGVPPRFGVSDHHSTYFRDWLEWTGITDITEIRSQPTLNGDAEAVQAEAIATARKAATTF